MLTLKSVNDLFPKDWVATLRWVARDFFGAISHHVFQECTGPHKKSLGED